MSYYAVGVMCSSNRSFFGLNFIHFACTNKLQFQSCGREWFSQLTVHTWLLLGLTSEVISRGTRGNAVPIVEKLPGLLGKAFPSLNCLWTALRTIFRPKYTRFRILHMQSQNFPRWYTRTSADGGIDPSRTSRGAWPWHHSVRLAFRRFHCSCFTTQPLHYMSVIQTELQSRIIDTLVKVRLVFFETSDSVSALALIRFYGVSEFIARALRLATRVLSWEKSGVNGS